MNSVTELLCDMNKGMILLKQPEFDKLYTKTEVKPEDIKRLQNLSLEMFKYFKQICEKNNLRFFFCGGCCIGALRHKGFIPWDDDIDVFMPREDYEKFIELWSKTPVDGYILQNPYIEPDFTQNLTKIRKDNTTFLESEKEKEYSFHKGIFIDIFPLDRVASTKFKGKMHKLDAIFMMLFTRKYIPPNEKGLKKIISKLALSIVPKSKYDSIKYKLDKSISKKSSKDGGYKYFGSMLSLSKEAYSSNMFKNMEELLFENRKFMVTAIYEEVLTKFYGDYMELPPVEERVWAHHPILIDFEKNYGSK